LPADATNVAPVACPILFPLPYIEAPFGTKLIASFPVRANAAFAQGRRRRRSTTGSLQEGVELVFLQRIQRFHLRFNIRSGKEVILNQPNHCREKDDARINSESRDCRPFRDTPLEQAWEKRRA
jgi:hypothetical protein